MLLQEHIKDIIIILCGDSHLDVAASLNNMANIYMRQGKYEEALEVHRKSLEIRTRIYIYLNLPGPDHSSTKQLNHCTCVGK